MMVMLLFLNPIFFVFFGQGRDNKYLLDGFNA